jgi:hypothetical protein
MMNNFDDEFRRNNEEFDKEFKKQLRFRNILTCVVVAALIIFGIIAMLK